MASTGFKSNRIAHSRMVRGIQTVNTNKRWLRAVLLSGLIAVPVANIGCSQPVQYTDDDHHDTHRWDADEDRHYRQYLGEKREEYRDFHQRNKAEQQDYWNWRHKQPER